MIITLKQLLAAKHENLVRLANSLKISHVSGYDHDNLAHLVLYYISKEGHNKWRDR